MTTHTPDRIERPKARPKQWRLMIVDDHPVVRRGVRDALGIEPGFSVVAEAADANQAIDMLRQSTPDLVIVDISLGSDSGLDLIKQIKSEFPAIKTLVLSVHEENLYAQRALRAGAHGYVQKTGPADELIDAVRTILSGGTALSSEMTERLVSQAVRGEDKAHAGVDALSDRELQIFRMIGNGLTTRRIAEQLCISIKTVETHRENIKQKLGISNAAELARYAVAWVEYPS